MPESSAPISARCGEPDPDHTGHFCKFGKGHRSSHTWQVAHAFNHGDHPAAESFQSLASCIAELEQAGYQAFMLSHDTEDPAFYVAEAINWAGDGGHVKRGGRSYGEALHAICLGVS